MGLRYRSGGESYTIYSYGLGDRPDAEWKKGSTQYHESDIVFSNGGFYQYPEGRQSRRTPVNVLALRKYKEKFKDFTFAGRKNP